ncbi:HAMP domain-containing histidine kinase [bacterium]|nr:HAMP domain-containing histidine kinase [bacterium]
MQNNEDLIKNQVRCVSHEIRNQLSVTDVYCEIIKKHLEKNNITIPSIDNALNCIKKSSQMISNSLLDLKAINNYEVKSYDLNLLVTHAVEMAKVYILDKKIELEFEASGAICVCVDENKFLAILLNLIKNAIEAIEHEGLISLKIELEKDVVFVKIFNNGEKIPEEFVAKIFDFGKTSKSYGSGLGLYICKNNLRLMGGDLSLLKSDDEGTEFVISLSVNKY